MELLYILLFLLILFILKCNCNRTEGFLGCDNPKYNDGMHARPFWCMIG